MARIYGCNDKNSLEERRFPSYQIQIWKGGKKQAYTYRDKKTGQQKEGEKFGNAPRPKGYSILDTQNEWKPSRLDIEEVRSLWRGNNWSQEELLLMLRSRFGISEIKEIPRLL